MPSVENLRYETKFVATSTELPTLERWIRGHTAAFRTAYPARQVNSVYLDDWDLSAYAENLSGVSERTKVRFRWYGDAADHVSGNLELKCKRNRAGWKETHPVAVIPFLGVRWREIIRSLRDKVLPNARIALDAHPQVVLVNRYWRRYFVSFDGNIRLTIDTDQVVCDQRRSATPQLTRSVNLPDSIVLEVKGAVEDRERIEEVLQGIPVRVSRHSKYAIGVQTIAAS